MRYSFGTDKCYGTDSGVCSLNQHMQGWSRMDLSTLDVMTPLRWLKRPSHPSTDDWRLAVLIWSHDLSKVAIKHECNCIISSQFAFTFSSRSLYLVITPVRGFLPPWLGENFIVWSGIITSACLCWGITSAGDWSAPGLRNYWVIDPASTVQKPPIDRRPCLVKLFSLMSLFL